MKKLVILPTLLIIAFLIASCIDNTTNNPSGETATTEPNVQKELMDTNKVSKTKDTISIDTFDTWKHNWDSLGKNWLHTNQLIAFNVPIADLLQTIDEKAVSSRFYLGLESTDTGYVAKTMVVGVNAKSEDMIDYAKGWYIYDLSSACPPYCGKKK